MPALSRSELLFAVFLIGQFAVVFFVVIKYVVDKIVERRFEEFTKKPILMRKLFPPVKKFPSFAFPNWFF